MTPAPIKRFSFSTEDFPAPKRLDAFREIYGSTIIKHDVEVDDYHAFRFAGEFVAGLDFGIARFAITPCRAPRGARHIDGDDVVLSIALSGTRLVRQRGREAVMCDGEAIMTSCADTGTLTIGSPCHVVSVRFSQAALRSRLADFDAALVRTVPRTSPGLALLVRYVELIDADDALVGPRLHHAVRDHLYDLAAVALGATRETQQVAAHGGVRAAHRMAILSEVDQRTADPTLSAVEIAAKLGLTPRYVHMLLEETGRTFTEHLLHRRLMRAAALLHDPLWAERRIIDIASEAGFGDLSYFNRSFRRHFGATPSEIRQTTKGSQPISTRTRAAQSGS